MPFNSPTFLLKIITRYFIQSQGLESSAKIFLPEEIALGSHSDVYIFLGRIRNRNDTLSSSSIHYIWVHSTRRPGGALFPAQCPQCGFFDCISTSYEQSRADTVQVKFQCTRVACNFNEAHTISPKLEGFDRAKLVKDIFKKKCPYGGNGKWYCEEL